VANIFLTDTAPGNIGYEANTGENLFFYHSPETCYYYFGTEGVVTFPRMKKFFYRDPEKAGWQFPLCEEGIKIDREDAYTRQIRNFCGVIQGTESPKIDGVDARKNAGGQPCDSEVRRNRPTGRFQIEYYCEIRRSFPFKGDGR